MGGSADFYCPNVVSDELDDGADGPFPYYTTMA